MQWEWARKRSWFIRQWVAPSHRVKTTHSHFWHVFNLDCRMVKSQANNPIIKKKKKYFAFRVLHFLRSLFLYLFGAIFPLSYQSPRILKQGNRKIKAQTSPKVKINNKLWFTMMKMLWFIDNILFLDRFDFKGTPRIAIFAFGLQRMASCIEKGKECKKIWEKYPSSSVIISQIDQYLPIWKTRTEKSIQRLNSVSQINFRIYFHLG